MNESYFHFSVNVYINFSLVFTLTANIEKCITFSVYVRGDEKGDEKGDASPHNPYNVLQ